jgi:chorismate mutase
MMLVNVDVAQRDIKHVYLDGAKSLRPDLDRPPQHAQNEGSTTVR